MRLNTAEKNALQAVEYLLWDSKVKISSIGLKEELCLHPDFPSMASISDALSEWRVPHLATRLNTSQLKEAPFPALAYLNVKGGIFAPIKSVDFDTVEWWDTTRGLQKESIIDFERKWDGVALLLEPNEHSGERNYSTRIKEQWISHARLAFLIFGVAFCLAIILVPNWNVIESADSPFIISLVIKFIGAVISGLLLWQSIDKDNPFLRKICHLNNKNNCNSILQSNASRITSWLSWSELGFIYFTGGFLSLVLGVISVNLSIWLWLGILGILSLPFTIYSFWYQKFVAKKWCLLCISVQVLLWMEFLVTAKNYSKYQLGLNSETIALITLSFCIPALTWALIKKPLSQASQLFELVRELQKVKYNEDYIRTVFKGKSTMPPIFDGMQTVILGNQNAQHVLTVVTNPTCGPCSRLHREINQLLDVDSKIKCQFVFLGPARAFQIAALFLDPSQKNKRDLMNSWYQNIEQDVKKWIGFRDVSIGDDVATQQFRLHSSWCELAGIAATPTLYLNGITLPTAFKVGDLRRIIPLLEPTESEVVST